MSKQDAYSPRTPADLERKYNFGQTFAKVFGLVDDAVRTAEEAKSAFDGLDQEQIFNLLTNYGKAQGIYRDDNGDVYVNASYIQSGTLADGVFPDTIARTSELPSLIEKLGYVDETGVTRIIGGVVTTDYVNALGITVTAAQIQGVLVIGQQLPSDLAVLGDIPDAISQLRNDIGFVTESGTTTIVKGIVTTDYVNALGISVEAARVNGKLTIGQLPDTVAQKSQIPTSISELVNDSGYLNETGVTTIVEGVVTTDYVQALGVTAYALESIGYHDWEEVIISGGEIQFSGGRIFNSDYDFIRLESYGELQIDAESDLEYYCGYNNVHRFYTSSRNYFELSDSGLRFYNGNTGKLISVAQFNSV